MPSDDYFVPTDLGALRMESELLTLENTFLKGQILSLEEEVRKARQANAAARKELERLRAKSASG